MLARDLDDARRRAHRALGATGDTTGELAPAIDAGDVGRALRAERRRRIAGVPPVGALEAWRRSSRPPRRAREGSSSTWTSLAGRARLGALCIVARGAVGDARRPSRSGRRPVLRGPLQPAGDRGARARRALDAASGYLTAMVAYLDELSPLFALPSPATPRAERSSRAAGRQASPEGIEPAAEVTELRMRMPPRRRMFFFLP